MPLSVSVRAERRRPSGWTDVAGAATRGGCTPQSQVGDVTAPTPRAMNDAHRVHPTVKGSRVSGLSSRSSATWSPFAIALRDDRRAVADEPRLIASGEPALIRAVARRDLELTRASVSETASPPAWPSCPEEQQQRTTRRRRCNARAAAAGRKCSIWTSRARAARRLPASVPRCWTPARAATRPRAFQAIVGDGARSMQVHTAGRGHRRSGQQLPGRARETNANASARTSAANCRPIARRGARGRSRRRRRARRGPSHEAPTTHANAPARDR